MMLTSNCCHFWIERQLSTWFRFEELLNIFQTVTDFLYFYWHYICKRGSKILTNLPELNCIVLQYQGLWSCLIILKLVFRCYFIYRLVEGFATASEVAKSIRPKLIGFTALSILYDLPRAYLNVNLFGSLCSFYYNVLIYVNGSFSYRYKRGMSTHWIVLLSRLD